MTLPNEALVSVAQAAEILGISRQRVFQLVKADKLASYRIGTRLVLERASVENRRDQKEGNK